VLRSGASQRLRPPMPDYYPSLSPHQQSFGFIEAYSSAASFSPERFANSIAS
jgi:hypothetical protein